MTDVCNTYFIYPFSDLSVDISTVSVLTLSVRHQQRGRGRPASKISHRLTKETGKWLLYRLALM